MNGVEKLTELGIEILPRWKNNAAELIIRKGEKEQIINCIHTVIYQGNLDNMPEEISTEHIQDNSVLPDEETRKFAFRSFVEALAENFPLSLTPKMIGRNLSRRIRTALNLLNIKEFGDNELENLLQNVEDSWNEFRNAYFWSPPSYASARRSYEDRHSWNKTIRVNHQTARTNRVFEIKVDFDVSCSCRNIYVSKSIRINDQKVNLTKFRGFCKKIREGKSIPYSYIR